MVMQSFIGGWKAGNKEIFRGIEKAGFKRVRGN